MAAPVFPQRRRFAAEVWVMPEDEPSQVAKRAAARLLWRLSMTAESKDNHGAHANYAMCYLTDETPPGSDLCGNADAVPKILQWW